MKVIRNILIILIIFFFFGNVSGAAENHSKTAPYSTIPTQGTSADNWGGLSVREFIQAGHDDRIRQNGTIYQIRFSVANVSKLRHFYFTIWRQNRTNFDRFAITEDLINNISNGKNIINLSHPIHGVQEGDFYGYYINSSAQDPLYVGSDTNHNTYFIGGATSYINYNWTNQASDNHIFVIESYMENPYMVFIGDSIISGTPLHRSFIMDTIISNDITNISTSIENHWGRKVNKSYQNMGYGGQGTNLINKRFISDVVDLSPEFVLMEGGVNDIDNVTGVLKTTILNNWESMLQKAHNNNITPVIMLILPCGIRCSDAARSNISYINEELIKKAQNYSPSIVVDARCYVGVSSPSGPSGNCWSANPSYSSDGIHFNSAGHERIAQAIKDSFRFVYGKPGLYNLIQSDGTIIYSKNLRNAINTSWRMASTIDVANVSYNIPSSGEIANLTIYSGTINWFNISNLSLNPTCDLYQTNGILVESKVAVNESVNFTTDMSPGTYYVQCTNMNDPNAHTIGSGAWGSDISLNNTTFVKSTGNVELQLVVNDYISRWRMDGGTGTIIPDENVTSGNDCTLHGTSWLSGGIDFDSYSDYVNCGGNKLTNMNSLTYVADLKPITSDATPRYIMGLEGTGSNWFKVLYIQNSWNLNYNNRGSTSNTRRYSKINALNQGVRQNVISTWSGGITGTSISMYVDNAQTQYSLTGDGDSIANDSGSTFVLGNRLDLTRPYRGSLYEAMVFNRVLSADDQNKVYNKIKYTNGDLIAWYDAGAGNKIHSIGVNTITPINTNYSVLYRQNATGEFKQVGDMLTGNSLIALTEKYQKTDVKIILNGNQIATPELISITFYTQGASGNGSEASIPSLTNIQNVSIGDTWGIVNFTVNQSNALTNIKYSINSDLSGSSSTLNQSSGTNRSVNITGLNNATKYYYSVYAWNSTNTSLLINSSIYNFSTNNNVIPPLIGPSNNYTIGSGAWGSDISLNNTTFVKSTGNVELQLVVNDYISRWRMDGGTGTIIPDENVTSGNDCTLHGTSWLSGGIDFDSYSDYVNCGGNKLTNMNSLTYVADLKPITSDATPRYIMGLEGTGSNWFKVLYIQNSWNLNYNNRGSTSNTRRYSKINALNQGVRQNVISTWSGGITGTSIFMYVDNAQTQYSLTGDGDSIANDSGSTFVLGNRLDLTRPYRGSLYEAMVFNRVLSADDQNKVYNKIKYTNGDLIAWYDAGAGNKIHSIGVNTITPINTNYSVLYRQNATGEFKQVGDMLTGNSLIALTEKYQKTDVKIILNGNQIATPELISITFYTQGASGNGSEASIPSLTNIQNVSIGDTWGIVNFTVNQSNALTNIKYSINSDLSGSSSTLNQSSGTNRSVNITGLNNATKYYYSVYAWNSTNTSLLINSSIYNFSTNSNVTLPPLLTTNFPPSLTNIQNVSIGDTWGIVNFTVNQSNALTNIKYSINSDLSGSSSTLNQSSGTNRSVNITGLNNATKYYYSVYAWNSTNTSLLINSSIYNFSTNSNVTLPPLLTTNFPPSLANIQNVSIGDTWGIVNFTVNQSNALTNIKYSINSDLSGSSSTLNQSSGTNRSVNITGLNNATKYYYSVYAWNSTNTSLLINSSIYNFSTNSNVTLPPLLTTNFPPSLTNIQNVSIGDTWGIVNFTVNQSNALTNIKYSINSDLSGSSSTLNQSSGTNRSVNITGLNNATKYYYSVYAWNSTNTSLLINSSIYNFSTNNNVIPPLIGPSNNYTIGSGAWGSDISLNNTTFVKSTGNVELQLVVNDYISRWRMDGGTGTIIPDENVTSGNDCTLHGTSWLSGGIDFDSYSDYVNCGGNKLTNMNSLTYVADLKPITSDATPRYIMGLEGTGSNWFKVLYIQNSWNLNYNNRGSTSNTRRYSKINALNQGVRQNVISTWSGGITGASISMYVDNAQTQYSLTGDGDSIANDSGSTFVLGNRLDLTRPYRGSLYEAMVFNRVLSADDQNKVYNKIKYTNGDLIAWYDAGAGNKIHSIGVNTITPINTNYSVLYRQNATGEFMQVGDMLTGNSLIALTEKYQKTDVKIILNGNQIATPKLNSIRFYS